MEWILLNSENLPDANDRILITDGIDIEYVWVTNQIEFVKEKDDKLVYKEITHWFKPEVPK